VIKYHDSGASESDRPAGGLGASLADVLLFWESDFIDLEAYRSVKYDFPSQPAKES
jgi:hypothetical protein